MKELRKRHTRHFYYKWMKNFVWFSFKKERKRFNVTSSGFEQGWTICRHMGNCPIYIGRYGWWKTEIRLGKLYFCFLSKTKLLKI